ncbi:acyl-CoA N-acyltransferase [Xylaria sp. CBS 124048]|nr:acyl-CoA N-acyltransferase [Xylaria sp. CBS 124048]
MASKMNPSVSVTPLTITKPEDLNIGIGSPYPSEAAAIAQVAAASFTGAFGHVVPPQDLATFLAATYSEAAILARMEDPSQRLLVARNGRGDVLGLVSLGLGRSDPCLAGDAATHVELGSLYVDTSTHGRGVGSALISAVEAEARAKGFKLVWLSVWEHNDRAQKLYKRLGYEYAGILQFLTGESSYTDWVLCKKL